MTEQTQGNPVVEQSGMPTYRFVVDPKGNYIELGVTDGKGGFMPPIPGKLNVCLWSGKGAVRYFACAAVVGLPTEAIEPAVFEAVQRSLTGDLPTEMSYVDELACFWMKAQGEYKRQVSELQAKLMQLRGDFTMKVMDLERAEHSLVRLEYANDQLENQVSQANGERDDYKEQIEATQMRHISLIAEIGKLDEKVNAAEKKVTDLEAKLAAAEQDVETLSAQAGTISPDELEALKQQVLDAQGDADRRVAEANTMAEQRAQEAADSVDVRLAEQAAGFEQRIVEITTQLQEAQAAAIQGDSGDEGSGDGASNPS